LVTPEKNINLKTLIGDLADKLEFASSLTTNISIETEPKKIPADLKLNIYRILQEQVNNIYKYAEAKNVSISIKIVKNEILVEIEDDGKGFDVKRKRKGVGITNMLNRVETFNGKMEIKSEPGKGCHIAISIPM
jgi:signal transduction histidine kinase